MKPNNTVIIIEDDRDDREILEEIFSEIGKPLELIFFESGPEAFHVHPC